VYGPGRGDSNAKNSLNSARLDNMGENFIVVDVMLLRKTTTSPTRFVVRETTIGMTFLMKDPFSRDNVSTSRSWNKLPGIILKQRMKLFFHCSRPIRINKSRFI
jgi:hypothetical protein